ncbi:DUF5412 family protein [Lysinibacillus telephonicus]|uniref:DUF5412 family protein n=1 Tax=Lysinibacillus telephonicus TaxID=1714840 RepID=UPI0024827101|nr:DUF5412 family protein [Lysinibacillus telephonicus]
MYSNIHYKVEMKKTYKKILTVVLIWILLFAGIIGYGIYWLFFDWGRFKDELINQSTSPNGTYTINAYLSKEVLQFHMQCWGN